MAAGTSCALVGGRSFRGSVKHLGRSVVRVGKRCKKMNVTACGMMALHPGRNFIAAKKIDNGIEILERQLILRIDEETFFSVQCGLNGADRFH